MWPSNEQSLLKRTGLTKRISRSISTILVLTFVQVIAGPILAPELTTSHSQAATLYDNVSKFVQWNNWDNVTANHAPYANTSGTAITGNGNEIKLTNDTGGKSGFLWNTEPRSINQDFSVSANYWFGAKDADGADGIMFVMRPLDSWPNDGTLNSTAGGTDRNGNNEIRVTFDTYQNSPEIADDHLNVEAVTSAGAYTNFTSTGVALKSPAGAAVTNIEDSAWRQFTITWTASSRTLSVYAGTASNALIYSTAISIAQADLSTFTWGWLGMTGGSSNDQSVADVTYHYPPVITTNPSDVTVAVGGTVTLTSPYTVTGTAQNGKWQFSNFNDNTWYDIASSSSTTYSFTATRANTLRKYRYYIESALLGTTYSATSSAATVTVTTPTTDTDTAIIPSGTFNGILPPAAVGEIIPASADAFTISAWVKPTNNCNSLCTIFYSDNSIKISYTKTKIQYQLYNSTSWGSAIATPDSSVALNQWSHIALVRNSGSTKIYINGVQSITTTNNYIPAAITTASGAYIGNTYNTSETFLGALDELKIYKSDRSAALQTDMFSNSTSGNGLVAYWNFNEGSGTSAFNQVLTGSSSTDISLLNNGAWNSTSISEPFTLASYSGRVFYRTYITTVGGWRAPTSFAKAGALVVGGGGAGGRGDASAWEAGGGGAGGVIQTTVSLTANSIYPIVVGNGGVQNTTAPSSGGNSTGFSLTAVGGGSGGYAGGVGGDGASGGGGTHDRTSGGRGTSGQGTNGETPTVSSFAGGGGGARTTGVNGSGGFGISTAFISDVATVYGDGGAGGKWSGASANAGGSGNGGTSLTSALNSYGTNGAPNTGSGGGGAYGNTSTIFGGHGGSGIVAVRWLTITKPTFTAPVNDTLTAGLTETFTVSTTPSTGMSRSYVWQSSSDTGTTWINLSTGSGFTSANYLTPTLETSTSGSRYQYRVVVMDTDTAGLFVVDTSTGVYLIINPRISISGSYTVQKYGTTHTDTFTALSSTGTGNKTFTYTTNTASGLTWNVATANRVTLTVAPTLKPGTYNETITATDTVNAKTTLGISIVVSKADTVTITVNSISETYTGSTLPTLPTFTVSGLLNSDTVTASQVTWSYAGTENSGTIYSASATKPINAGSYTITPSVSASLSDSYTATTIVTAPLTITRATRTITETISATTVKYGNTLTLTSSVTSGSGLGTTTYSTSNSESCTVSGSTITAIKSAGTCSFTATITQTANFETATSIAKTATLSKADTITVTAATPRTFTYTGSQVALVETATVSGLKLSDTTTSTSATFSYGAFVSNCASGGACAIGDIGPGGGIVFYDAGSQQPWGRYLEIAKSGWSGTPGEKSALWCTAALATTTTGVQSATLGAGYANSVSLASICGAGAAFQARAYNGGGKSDWFLPTSAEFQLAFNNRSYLDLNASGIYWLSHEASGADSTWVANAWVMGSFGAGGNNKNSISDFRPIRAFAAGDSSTTYTTTLPTNAGTYVIKVSDLVLTSGSLSNYTAVDYLGSTLTINKAKQAPLIIAQYGAIFGTPYRVIIIGGSGTGAITETVTAGTASSCTISGDTVTASTVGTCIVTATKASDTNYESATATAAIYFLIYVIDQPTGQVGSGPTIALNGATGLVIDNPVTNQVPSISTLSTYTATVGQSIIIRGTGFLNNADFSVEFWRGVPAITYTVDSSTQITVTVPTGARTGKVLVITTYGTGVSLAEIAIS